jgi:putative FmdB family regulatory protein
VSISWGISLHVTAQHAEDILGTFESVCVPVSSAVSFLRLSSILAMPLYEYLCKQCEARFETLVTGAAQPHCPSCESTELEQQYSSFAVGAVKGKGQFSKSAPSRGRGACGNCGDPRGPGSCSTN